MNLQGMTTDELLTLLPTSKEDDRWEIKSAQYLEPAKKGELKQELSKQVSAFANSGGGFIVFGLSNSGGLQECPKTVSRQSMKDFLATMIEQSVEYPIRDFQVYPIRFTADPNKEIYVVKVGDSAAAPHQSRADRIYYYRIDGHSKPAPHFHVELLRNRMTKSVVEIVNLEMKAKRAELFHDMHRLYLDLYAEVENRSFQATTNLGILGNALDRENWLWRAYSQSKNFAEGICFRAETTEILPFERTVVVMQILCELPPTGSPLSNLTGALHKLAVEFRPVTQNNVGHSVIVSLEDHSAMLQVREQFKRVNPGHFDR